MTNLSLSFENFEADFNRLKNSNSSANEFLNLFFIYSNHVISSRTWKGRALYLPQLDQAMLWLSGHPDIRVLSSGQKDFASGPAVILVTEVYLAGGHGRLANQIIESLPAQVIFTDLFGRIINGHLHVESLIEERALSKTVLLGRNLWEKLAGLLNILNSTKPRIIFLLGHHQDVIVQMAGIIYSGGKRTIFVHHCDHEPALGASIRYPMHVDSVPEIAELCNSLGLPSRTWPLSKVPATRVKDYYVGRGRIMTCGSELKFQGSCNGVEYKDIVFTTLATDIGVLLYHVGPLPDVVIREINEYLNKNGVDPTRFCYVGPVADIGEFVYENEIDLCLQSFPLGGGLTTVEMLNSGLPIIYANPDVWGLEMIAIRSLYANRELEWSKIDDIPMLINKVFNSTQWKKYHKDALSKYNSCFHPRHANKFFENINAFFDQGSNY